MLGVGGKVLNKSDENNRDKFSDKNISEAIIFLTCEND